MGHDVIVELVAADRIEELIKQARCRLAALPRSDSRYQDLVRIARLYQEMGDALVSLFDEGAATKMACARGCDTCCHIPSVAAGFHPDNTFGMNVLDAIILMEKYEGIKQADSGLPSRTLASANEARSMRDIVRCPHLTAAGMCAIYEFRPVACKIWFSAELALCAKNRQMGYPVGVNRWTDASVRLYRELTEPFMTLVAEIAPQLPAKGDFLEILEEISMLDKHTLLSTFRLKIDVQELDSWRPFEAEPTRLDHST